MTAIDKRKKQSRTRAWFQAAWFALTNGYLRGYTSGKIFGGATKYVCVPGLNCYSCPGAFGSCPIGSLQAVLGTKNYRVSLYVFGLLTAFGAFFGRLVCGWLCPFGFAQDMLFKIPVGTKKKNLPFHKYLRHLRILILIVFVLLLPSWGRETAGIGKPAFCEYICPSGLLLGGIPLTLMNKGFQAAIGFRFWWKFFILAAIIILSVVRYRPFCKYLCPLGLFYGAFNPVSTYRLKVDPDKCIKCAACQNACGMDIRTFETPNSSDCIRCGACIAACPTKAISSTWGTTASNIRSRRFIADSALLETCTAAAAAQPGKMVFFGILLIICGITSIYNSVMPIYSALEFAVVFGVSTSVHSLWYLGIKLLASIMMTLTGIFAIWNRNRVPESTTIHEKIQRVYLIYLISVIVFIILFLFFSSSLMGIIIYPILNPILLLGAPFFLLASHALTSLIRDTGKGKGLWYSMSAVLVFLTFIQLILFILSSPIGTMLSQ